MIGSVSDTSRDTTRHNASDYEAEVTNASLAIAESSHRTDDVCPKYFKISACCRTLAATAASTFRGHLVNKAVTLLATLYSTGVYSCKSAQVSRDRLRPAICQRFVSVREGQQGCVKSRDRIAGPGGDGV